MAFNQHLPYNNTAESKGLTCWAPIKKGLIGENEISLIDDPNTGEDLLSASIPNPLARLYLFENAFKQFTKRITDKKHHTCQRDQNSKIPQPSLPRQDGNCRYSNGNLKHCYCAGKYNMSIQIYR